MSPRREVPKTIGPYAIVGILGEGGMGTVYLAEQEEPVKRTVALKVLSRDRSSQAVLARFEAERQALAVMDHPGIAKVFDAGVTDEGVSYFAMERVVGAPITSFCDERDLTLDQRLRLFTEVCRAVQHAHQKGLIHRDLKPSNILVSELDGRGVPRIIDFGIAKAVEDEAFDGTRLTTDDQIIGTPAYMSPEQIDHSRDIDTRSDIYSLGTVLYELLVGALPYDSESYRGWAAIAATLHREPPRPTRRVAELGEMQQVAADRRSTTVVGLRAALKGDLDWIVSKAMEKDRERRYETANGLALDIERYLGHEPVRARSAGTSYLVQKFVRRNRAGVAFAASAVVGMAAFTVTTVVQANRIAAARDIADARRDQAEGLIDFMLGDLRTKLQPIGRLEILDDIGTEAMAYFRALPESEFTDEELVRRSQALYQIGEVRAGEGRLSEARTTFEESLRLAREFSSRAPDDPDRLFALGQSEFWVGYMDWRTGDFRDALEHFEPYREISERLVARDPTNVDWRLESGYAHSNIGSIQEALGQFDFASESFRASLAVDSFVVAQQPGDLDRQLDLARSHNTLAVALAKAGRFREAERQHRAELVIKLRLVESDPANTIWLREVSLANRFLGALLEVVGDDVAADRLLAASVDVSRGLVVLDPSNATWQDGLAYALTQRAMLTLRSGDRDAARAALAESGRILAQLRTANPDNPRWRRMAAHTHYGLARIAERERRLEVGLEHVLVADSLLAPAMDATADPEATELLAHLLLLRGDLHSATGNVQAATDAWEGVLAATDGSRTPTTGLADAAEAGARMRLGPGTPDDPSFDALEQGGLLVREPWSPPVGD